MEKALFEWVCHQHASRININGDIIRQKAAKLQALANEKIPVEEQTNLIFSDGWLDKFKRRWGLRVFRSHGEAGDADVEAMERELSKSMEIIADYSPNNVFNADECGLLYSLAPDKTTALERFPG